MREKARPISIRIRHKYLVVQALVTLVAVVLAEGVSVGIALLVPGQPAWGFRLSFAALVAVAASVPLALWASRAFGLRLARLIEVSRAWLHGSLSLRVADSGSDDLAVLSGQLDVLAEHLEQDEQDLARLREQSTRQTDQVRALAVDEERERLARELHDGVKQHLFSLSMTASALRARLDTASGVSEDVGEMIREVETTAKSVQRSLTRLIEDLRPAPLQEKGLAAALNDYTLLFGAREHILVYLDVQGNDVLVPPSVSEALYRVAQEALHNVARHARATRVDVRLWCFHEQVVLSLRDNGTGFDTSQAHRGLGLGNMQDRMVSVGGRVEIESQPGAGTRVRAEVRLAGANDLHPDVARLDRERPQPTIQNWGWLGQRLMIPVGQTWPWLPADQLHLRRPLVETDQAPVVVRRRGGFLRLGGHYAVGDQRGMLLAHVRHHLWGYGWRSDGARWQLRHIEGPRGTMRSVLVRNGQPLAAAQHQGRLVSTWSEIVYDDSGYGLSCVPDPAGGCVLTDSAGEPVLSVSGLDVLQITLRRPVALPLLLMAAARILEERVLDRAAFGHGYPGGRRG